MKREHDLRYEGRKGKPERVSLVDEAIFSEILGSRQDSLILCVGRSYVKSIIQLQEKIIILNKF